MSRPNCRRTWAGLSLGLLALPVLVVAMLPDRVHAIPAFNRQTGQNCVARHAGGQFPELTPYGRLLSSPDTPSASARFQSRRWLWPATPG